MPYKRSSGCHRSSCVLCQRTEASLGTLQAFCVRRSSSLRDYKLDFDFYCRRPRLRWSASAFPDLLTRSMLFRGTYDEDVLVALENLIHPGDVVFDVGGHHGLMTVVAARAAGPDGLVVTFEPNPHAREQILRNAALNDVRNIVLEEIALSDTQRRHTLLRSDWRRVVELNPHRRLRCRREPPCG